MKWAVFVATALVALTGAMPDTPTKIKARGTAVQQPVTSPTLDSPTVQGCFKSPGDLKRKANIQFNTIGSCGTNTCYQAGFAVGATMGGKECWCGQKYPPKQDLANPKMCNVSCSGYGDQACGGINFWTVYNTGVTLIVDNSEPSRESSSTTEPTAVVTQAGPTVVVTQPASDGSGDGSSSSGGGGGGTNVAGIAAGVVVSVVVVAAAIGGVFLYMRRKRNWEIEEDHRRNAAVNAFIGKPPGSSDGMSMTDARMDPVMAHRRLSDGSIADNQDYSRKILRVTNA